MAEKEVLFETEFINKSNRAYEIRERSEVNIIAVCPAEGKFVLVSYAPTTYWARFKEVLIDKHRRIEVKVNKAWKMPFKSDWVTELVNDGDVIQSIRFVDGNPLSSSGGYVHVRPGVPLLVPTQNADDMAQYVKVWWHRDVVTKPLPGVKDFFTTNEELVCTKVKRPLAELERIIALRKELAIKRAVAEAERAVDIKAASILATTEESE